MEFRILGPIEVLDGRGQPLVLGGPKPRALLAVLLVHANHVVSSGRLIDELWGEQPPPTATNLLQGYISKLRQSLHTGQIEEAAGQVLVTRPPGYLLKVDAGQLDLHHFEGLVDDARQAIAEEAFDRAAATLREALSLWRGPPLAGATLGFSAQAEALHLEESRLSALEERIEADLSCGRHAQLVGELQALVTQQPLRERLRGQFMLALYRSGRQTEALATYRQAQQVLTDELGVDPGLQLQRLQHAILTHDPSIQFRHNDAARSAVAVTTVSHQVTPDRHEGSGRNGVGGVGVETPPDASATPPLARPPAPAHPRSTPRQRWHSRLGLGQGGRRMATAIGLTVFAIGLLAGVAIRHRLASPPLAGTTTPADRPAGVVVAYNFDQGINTDTQGNRFVVDATGHGHIGSLVTGQASDLTVIARNGHGKAVQFPAPCTPSPTVSCPLTIIESPNATDLNPGTQNFSYGADILLQPTQASANSNIMQKGVATGGGSQWKLRIEDTANGTPSCVVIGKGSTTIYKATANVNVADNTWHNIRCSKTATMLTISIGFVNHGQVSLPAGLAIANDSPMRIGGKNVSQNNDNNQFFGALDNVYFHLDKQSKT